MTNEEAIASLKALCHTCKFFPTCVNDKPECFRAIEMAIKSLDAWEKVKVEMHEQYRIFANISSIGDVWADAIEIVDKHLSEVENESQDKPK